MKRSRLLFGILSFTLTTTLVARPQQHPEGTTIAGKTAGMEKLPGYFPFYWDAKGGKVWLEIDKWDTEFLYVNSLPAGIGSNDIGLDRGQLGDDHVVRFSRSGPKVLLTQINYNFRAVSNNPDERKAVEDAFAQSVLGGFDVAAEEGTRVLVDATNFFLRDAHDVSGTLRRTQQGNFRLDPARSAFYLPRTKNFPQNTEVEVTLTFAGDDPGGWLQSVTPSPHAVTVRQHHSFIQLPDSNYRMRKFDPHAGFFGIRYMDYATPIQEPIVKQYIARHRLQKKDPTAARSEPVKPITYYLDRGAPEPIRSALLEGARWWNQAFEAAGYINAFRVEMMPEDADPMDARYNVIQWVHRSTRGWSYGSSISDPRTGEIIQGHVTLGSLRVRQDFLIAEGLVAKYQGGGNDAEPMLRMALARLRQLAAHEVGHTLGLAHNYAASVNNRASVMDYPHPWIKLGADGSLDLSDAYAVGIGEWDKSAIMFGYQDFPPGTDEAKALEEHLRKERERGLLWITDQDARPQGGAHPLAHLWDSGSNAVDELDRVMKIRAVALKRFSEENIRIGAPMATLEEVFVPVYLFHRYQAEAAVKVLGGLNYTYAVRGDGQKPTEMIAAAEQRRALDSLLQTISPTSLAIREDLLRQIPPRAWGYQRSRELFRLRTSPAFDPLAAAESAADFVVGLMLTPERAARLVEYHARDAKLPGFGEVLDKLIAATWKAPRCTTTAADCAFKNEVHRTVDQVTLMNLLSLAANERASAQVRALASLKIEQLKNWATTASHTATDESQVAHLKFAVAQIKRFETDPKQMNLTRPAQLPDGPPIGSGEGDEFTRSWFACDWPD